MRKLLPIILAAAYAACSPPPSAGDDVGSLPPDSGDAADEPTGLEPLVDHTLWVPVAPSEDPFGDRPHSVDCEQGVGWGVEPLDLETSLGVDTNYCNYFTAQQPLQLAVEAGETIGVRAWHFPLTGAGQAHLAVRIDDTVIFERRLPIPADSQLLIENFVAPRSFEAGLPIYFHIHNHGGNTYNLIDVVRGDVD